MLKARSRRLPPLNSLRAFEAAARHQSFTRAAVELAVTHGAVSRHVAKLEEFLDAELFERKHHQIVLTKKGAAYAARLEFLFDQIREATFEGFEPTRECHELRIAVLPTFAMRLLVPRLAQFRQQYPEIELQVEIYGATMPDDPKVDADIVVRLGDGSWANAHCEHLFSEELVPVGSPSLIQRHAIDEPNDLRHFLLLHSRHRANDWKRWLNAAGASRVDGQSGLHLEYSGLVYQGARDGLGLAMALTMFVHDDVEQGRLVRLFDKPFRTGRDYYVVCGEDRGTSGPAMSFVSWLKQEVATLHGKPSTAGDLAAFR